MTPRQLVEEYRKLRPDLTIEVDPKTHTISFGGPSSSPPGKRGFFEWLRSLF